MRVIGCRSRRRPVGVLVLVLCAGCSSREQTSDARLTGDWDYYVMLGAAPNGGFEARRRMGFAHFDGPSATGAWLKRRSGASLAGIRHLTLTANDVVLSLEDGGEIRAVLEGNTIAGRLHRGGAPVDRVWLVKRTTPPVWEPNYELWPGEVSQPTFKFTIESAVPMKARDGTTLMNYVAKPVRGELLNSGAFSRVTRSC